ncbi:ClbS/DfsB family four-helix bundle protein, partial [Lentibacter algarum]
MAAASNKSELMKVTAREWDRIYPLLKDLPEEFAVLPDEEGVSIKDVVVHRAHWIG